MDNRAQPRKNQDR